MFVKSSDGAASRWAQFNPELVAALHANGLRACAWQFVYGNDPLAEASLGADAIADGADCLVIDAESQYKGKYAPRSSTSPRCGRRSARRYPIGFTSFPYVDYHATLPYSVFLGPGAAQANLPQVYWKDIGGTVDAVSGRTLAQNRIYGTAIAPLGQTYGRTRRRRTSPASARCGRPTAAPGCRGGRGSTRPSPAGPRSPQPVAPLPLPPADPGWPALARAQGRPGRVAAAAPRELRPGGDGHGDVRRRDRQALRNFQSSRGLPVTGTTDALTWQAVLGLPLQPVDWQTRK